MRNRSLTACVLGLSLFVLGCEQKFPEPPQPPTPMGPEQFDPQNNPSQSETIDKPDAEDSTGAM